MKHNKYIKQRKESQEFDFEIDQNDIPQKYNIMLLESPKNNAQNGKKVKEPDEEFFDLDQYDPNEEGIKNVGITIINKRNSFEVPEKEQTYNTKNQQEDDMYRSPVAVTTHQKNQDEIDEDISMNHQQDEIYTENTTTNKKVLKSKQINNNKISNSAKQTTAITYSKSSVIKNDYTQLNVPTDNDIEEEYQQDFESLENDNQIEQENNNNKQSKVEKTLQHPPRNLQKQTVYSRRTQKSLDSETKKSQSNTSRKKDVSIVAEEGTRGKYERQMQKLFAAYGTKNSPTNIELFPQSKIKTINDKIKDLVKKLNSELNELLNKNTLLLQAVNDNSKQKARNSNARNLIDQISNLDQLRKNNNKVIERLQLELQKLVSRESEVKEPFYEINLMKNIESYLQKKREVEAAINKMKLNVSKESKKLTRVTQRKQKEEFTAVTQQQKVEYLHLVKEETKHQKHLAQLDSKIETFSTKYESLEEKYKQLARTVSQKAVETKPQITLQEQYQQLKLKQSIQQKNLNNSQKILQRKYDRLQQQISLLYRQNKNYNLQIKNIYNQIDYVMKHSIIAIEKIKQNPKFVTPIKESLMIILKSLENQPVDNVFDVINESLTRKSHRSHIFSKKEKREHSQLSAVVTKSQEKNQYKPKNFKLRQKDDHKSRSTKPKFNPKINQLEKQQSHPHLQAFNSQIQTKRNLLEQQQLNNKKISKVKDQNNNSNKNIKIQDHNKKIEKQFQKSELKNNKNEDSFFPLKSPVSKDYNNNIQHQRPEVQMKLESQQIDLSKPSFMFRRKIGNINNNINNNLNPPPYESGHNKSISQIMPQQHEQQIQQPKQKETDINLAPRMMRIQRNNRSISSKNNLSKQQQQYNPTGITITPPPIILNNQNFKLLNKNDSSDKTTINNENNNSNVNSSIIDNSNNPLNLSNSSEIPKPNFLRRFNLRKNNQQQQQINSYNPSLLQQPTQKPTTNYNYDKKLYQQTTTNNKNFQKFVDKKITLPNNNTNMNSQQQQQNNQNNNSFSLSRNNNNKVDNNNTNNIQQYDNNSYSKNDNNNNNNVNNMNNLNNNINNNNNNQTKQNIEKANNNNNSNNNNNVSLNKDKDSESITKITNPYAQNILNQQSNKNIHHHQREGKLKKNKIEGIKQKIDIYEAANEEPIVNNNILAKTPNRQQNLHPSRNLQSNNNTKNQEVDDINKLLGIKPKNSDPEDDLLFGSKPVQKKKFGGKRQEDFFGFDV